MNEQETKLVEAIGMKPCRVLTRWPLTIAFERHSYLPGLFTGTVAFGISYQHGVLAALAAAAIAGLAFTLSLVAHECGHLLLGRRVRGVTPRLLLMRSIGGVSIVEGRYGDARGAALFAAGGPLATLAITVAYVVAGLLLPAGPSATGLLLPAVLNLLLLGVNLLPVTPMDGYLLFRSALWASVGSRAEAERRAIRWSRRVLVYGLLVSVLVFCGDQQAGMLALLIFASLAVQHRAAVRQVAPARRAL
jgi:Zn-dependent protease